MSETGVVKWFSAAKGFGFIKRDGQADVFVHASEVLGGEELQTDDTVEYEIGEGKKGPVAQNVKVVR